MTCLVVAAVFHCRGEQSSIGCRLNEINIVVMQMKCTLKQKQRSLTEWMFSGTISGAGNRLVRRLDDLENCRRWSNNKSALPFGQCEPDAGRLRKEIGSKVNRPA